MLLGNLGLTPEAFADTTTIFLIIDEDSIDDDVGPNFFSKAEINDNIANLGVRSQLPFFASNIGSTITLHTGQVGDEGLFELGAIPASWDITGPTDNGLKNFIAAGPGLGSGVNPETLLDKIPDVTPLRVTELGVLVGVDVCAVVYDSDISINYDSLEGNLQGNNLGIVAFNVISVTPLGGSSLPAIEIKILDADVICELNNNGGGPGPGPGGATGATGPTGPAGPTGPTGPAGP